MSASWQRIWTALPICRSGKRNQACVSCVRSIIPPTGSRSSHERSSPSDHISNVAWSSSASLWPRMSRPNTLRKPDPTRRNRASPSSRSSTIDTSDRCARISPGSNCSRTGNRESRQQARQCRIRSDCARVSPGKSVDIDRIATPVVIRFSVMNQFESPGKRRCNNFLTYITEYFHFDIESSFLFRFRTTSQVFQAPSLWRALIAYGHS